MASDLDHSLPPLASDNLPSPLNHQISHEIIESLCEPKIHQLLLTELTIWKPQLSAFEAKSLSLKEFKIFIIDRFQSLERELLTLFQTRLNAIAQMNRSFQENNSHLLECLFDSFALLELVSPNLSHLTDTSHKPSEGDLP